MQANWRGGVYTTVPFDTKMVNTLWNRLHHTFALKKEQIIQKMGDN